MIGVIDVEIQAANVSMPLYPVRAFVNSPSSIRLRNVPRKIGQWNITSVQIVAAYPDSSIKTANCVLVGGVWVGTIEGCSISGRSENGFTVFASGIDENGNPVSNYVLGKGLIEILEGDGTITPDAPFYYVHLLDQPPETPKEGDLWQGADEIWYIRKGTANKQLDKVAMDVAETASSTASAAMEAATSARDIASSAMSLATNINTKIPAQATTSNQLADKAFVNSSVQTATANFRGNWATWNDVPTNVNDYPADYAGNKTPTVNDYLVVQDVVVEGNEGTWRYKYSGVWATDGKNGWLPEYQVNETPMTAAQLAAINSNITTAKVAQYDEALTKFNYELYSPMRETMTLRQDIFPITYTDNNTTYTVQYSDYGTTLTVVEISTMGASASAIYLAHNNGTTNPTIVAAKKTTGLCYGGILNKLNVKLNGSTPTIGTTPIYDVSGGLVLKNRAINIIDLSQTFNNPTLVFPYVTFPQANDFILHVDATGSGYTPSLSYPNYQFYNDSGDKPEIELGKQMLIYISFFGAGNYYLLKEMKLQGVAMS